MRVFCEEIFDMVSFFISILVCYALNVVFGTYGSQREKTCLCGF